MSRAMDADRIVAVAAVAPGDRSLRVNRGRPSERGQVLVLFILIFATTVLIAGVAVAVGQVMVRRHQAQMAVDAAAFAGASKQAEGLNTIAKLNELSLFFLNAIQYGNFAPYIDSDGTTSERLAAGLLSGVAAFFVNDWAGDILEDYQDGFDVLNSLVDLANCAYAMPFLPRMAASDIVDQNFGGGDAIFEPEDLDGHGVVDPLALIDLSLVELTDPEEYDIGAYYYMPYPLHSFCSPSTCASFPVGTALCAYCYGTYATMNGFIFVYRNFVDEIKYELGRFYDQDEGDDVRFAYYVKVSQTPVLFGKTFFNDIPEIVVAAAAKPYGGYLGDEFEGFIYSSPQDISATYKAKLVPLNQREKLMLLLQAPSSDDPAGLTILH